MLALHCRYKEAAADAQQVIALDRRWVKGWSRLAAALFAMEEWSEVSNPLPANSDSSLQIHVAALCCAPMLAVSDLLLDEEQVQRVYKIISVQAKDAYAEAVKLEPSDATLQSMWHSAGLSPFSCLMKAQTFVCSWL